MKNSVSKTTWGILFIIFGLALAGKAFGLFNFNIFFRGWWTLFIIIPCSAKLSDPHNRSFSIVGLGIGVLLFLSAQGVFEWYMFGKALIAFIFIVIGCTLLVRNNQRRDKFDNHSIPNNEFNSNQDNNNNNGYTNTNSYNQTYENNSTFHYESSNNTSDDTVNNFADSNTDGNNYNNYRNSNYGSTNHGGYNHFSGILSGRTIQFVDEVFTGAVVSSILGNVQMDLRNAIFTGNAVVDTTCILGGVDFFVPPNVKVVMNCTPILAGVDNNIITPSNASSESFTLFINGTCILGGIEVK